MEVHLTSFKYPIVNITRVDHRWKTIGNQQTISRLPLLDEIQIGRGLPSGEKPTEINHYCLEPKRHDYASLMTTQMLNIEKYLYFRIVSTLGTVTLSAFREDMIDIEFRLNLQPFIGNGNSSYDWNILELNEQHQTVNEAQHSLLQYLNHGMSSLFLFNKSWFGEYYKSTAWHVMLSRKCSF